MKNDSLLA